jgi:hypothetical protein
LAHFSQIAASLSFDAPTISSTLLHRTSCSAALLHLRQLLGSLGPLFTECCQLVLGRADHLVNLLAVLEDLEGGHGADATLLGHSLQDSSATSNPQLTDPSLPDCILVMYKVTKLQ